MRRWPAKAGKLVVYSRPRTTLKVLPPPFNLSQILPGLKRDYSKAQGRLANKRREGAHVGEVDASGCRAEYILCGRAAPVVD